MLDWRALEVDRESGRRKKAMSVLAHLRAEYGHHDPSPRLSPTDSLIATVLSQHTADRNSNAAFLQLKRRYGSWQSLAIAPEGELAGVIRPAGLANIKARRIQDILEIVHARYGTYDLTFLKGHPIDESLALLKSLPGVGPKTAACVLLFGCGLPAMPVDTHVHRVTRRLGLIGPADSAERAHELLADVVSPADIYDFHVDLIAHGRQICKAQRPECGRCVLQGLCDYYQTTVVRGGGAA